ncbi:heme NO binding protein [Dictyocaulus viviparus]|uniref:Heme NO binding protein n=1 Tax=Dictyocaulus viviparus TaxID=29172 RepID=A0A0D8Y666_DICVI|nr:heme NO binding protein [Dictyocaulus viviparus]
MWEMYGGFLITYACETGWEKMLCCMANNLQDQMTTTSTSSKRKETSHKELLLTDSAKISFGTYYNRDVDGVIVGKTSLVKYKVSMKEFLDNLNTMHYYIDQIAFKSEMRGPTFQCESVGVSSLRLHYFSHRQGLFPIVKGLVRQTAHVLFDMDVIINVVERSQERRKCGMVEHVVFSVEPDDKHRIDKILAYKFKRESRSFSDANINVQFFISLKSSIIYGVECDLRCKTTPSAKMNVWFWEECLIDLNKR